MHTPDASFRAPAPDISTDDFDCCESGTAWFGPTASRPAEARALREWQLLTAEDRRSRDLNILLSTMSKRAPKQT